jgi:hypothetical protein
MSSLRNNKVSVAAESSSLVVSNVLELEVQDAQRFEDISLLIFKNNSRLFSELNGRFSDEISKIFNASQQQVRVEPSSENMPKSSNYGSRKKISESESTVCTIV